MEVWGSVSALSIMIYLTPILMRIVSMRRMVVLVIFGLPKYDPTSFIVMHIVHMEVE